MSTSKAHFVWCELCTTDPTAAIAFYRRVVGWNACSAPPPNGHYTIVSAGQMPVGGIMQLPAAVLEAGGRPAWIGYIGVDDVDAYAERVAAAGGKIYRPADDIPGVGRFAIVADPHGAVFCLFMPHCAMTLPADDTTPGRVGWHELHAGDREADFAFYAGLFGWTKTEAIDLGPMGVYQTFATGGPTGDAMTGGMMTRSEGIPAPTWLYYFTVDDIRTAAARVTDAGGQVLMGPHQVPDNSWIVHCLDPQGVMFALVGPNPSA